MGSEPIYKKNPMTEPYDVKKDFCTLCFNTGWLLETKDRGGVVTMEIIPCLIPDCEKSGQEVKLLSVNLMYFTNCRYHPNDDKFIMSLGKY